MRQCQASKLGPLFELVRRIHERRAVALAAIALTNCAVADVLQVGPGEQYLSPSEAAMAAKDGDTIEVAPGLYTGDVAVWHQNDLTIRGRGERPRLAAAGQAAEAMGIWVIRGDNVAVENFEFSGSRVAGKNGAGIRHQGGKLTVRDCVFRDNENGILSNRGSGLLHVDRSVFYENGAGDGYSHNIYAGRIEELRITGSYFHHARVGHNIKSRAIETYVYYSKIADGTDGESSYLIDLPDAGYAEIVGNVLQQGPASRNRVMISFGAESPDVVSGTIHLIHNTLVNDRPAGLFVKITNPLTRTHLQNNLFFGPGSISNQQVRSVSNVQIETEKGWFWDTKVFIDRAKHDYHLAPGSSAIDAGSPLDPKLMRRADWLYEYGEPLPVRRAARGLPDAGAFEYAGD